MHKEHLMNLLQLQKYLSAALLLVMSYSTFALATATVTVSGTGDTSYSIDGSGLVGVAGIKLDINYDAASLSSPTANKGGLVSGAMFVANTSRPGSISIAIISTTAFSGSGPIATISFAGKSGTGGITSASVSMIDSKGTAVAAFATVTGASGSGIAGLSNTPGVPFSQPAETITTTQPNQSQATSTSQAGSSTTTSLGTVTMPTDQQQPVTTVQPPPSPAVPAESPVQRTAELTQPASDPAPEVKPEETPQYVVYKGISDRFKSYDGSRKLAAVAALFDKKIAQTIQQSPAIVISNGKDKALLTVDIPARIKSSPNFAVHDGTMASFQQDKQLKGRWMVVVLPESGSLKTTVTIIAGAEEFEYPLTVAPPVKTALTFDEKGWDTFISEVGTAKKPLHDFNNDGIRDYIDEYIFAANIIAKKTPPAKPAPTAPPKSGK